ncbi:MAG: DNA repair exonuclease [Fimbriimonadales bacterium]|nr:DNA repair exonuclease [Fimbriimonadales bacterium]
MLRIAHTADVHLGRAFGYLGEAASAHQERVARAFRRVFEQARQRECHLVLIAGDLFDSPRVSRRWIEFALGVIEQSQLPTIVIPGNHDPPEQHPFRDISLPRNLLFSPRVQRWRLDALHAEVVACPAGDEARWQPALRREPDGAPLQIALMHGSMPHAGDEGVIQPRWIAESELDYVALGDWHSPQEWTQGRTVCWYSGAPEMVLPRQQLPGAMLIVELVAPQRARVLPVPVGEAHYVDGADDGILSWDVSSYLDTQSLLSDLRARLRPESVAIIRLTGRWQGTQPLNIQALTENLQPSCLWLEIEAAYQPETLSPHTPFEHILAQVAQEAAARTPDDAKLYQEAMQLGIYLLRGGRL